MSIPPDDSKEQLAAFEAYRVAKEKLDKSLTFADAMEAKRAWVHFLYLVDRPSAQIIPLPRRFPDFGGDAA